MRVEKTTLPSIVRRSALGLLLYIRIRRTNEPEKITLPHAPYEVLFSFFFYYCTYTFTLASLPCRTYLFQNVL